MIALEFIRRNWQALAIVAIVGVVFLRVQILKSERDDALATIAELRTAALKQAVEVQVSEQAGKRAVETITERNKSDIQHIGGLYGNEIHKRDASIADYRVRLANSLRKQSVSDYRTVPDDVADKSTGNDCNRAASESDTDYKMMYNGAVEYIHTLKQAGAVCAADYNMCRDYVISEQTRIGVHEPD